MYLHRPEEQNGRRRFLLALSLSTVTAVVVAAPLALKAATVDTSIGGPNTEVSENDPSPSSTSTTEPAGPRIRRNQLSSGIDLTIGPGDPSDVPEETSPATYSTRRRTTRRSTTVASTTTTTSAPTTTTTTDPDQTTSTDSTVPTTSSSTSSTSSSSTSTPVATDTEP